MASDCDVLIIGAGPKSVALQCHLASRGINDVIAIERATPIGTWESAFAGTSPTRTGIYYSDVVAPGQSSLPCLVDFARDHPLMTRDMFLDDNLPKEVLQDYLRSVIVADDHRVLSNTEVVEVSCERSPRRFKVRARDSQVLSCRVLVDASGIVWSKSWPQWTQTLDPGRVFHSIGHGVLGDVAGRRILVVGGGHATPDIATRLSELHAQVVVFIRGESLKRHLLPYAQEYLSPSFQRRFSSLSPVSRYRILQLVKSQGPWVTPKSYNDMIRAMDVGKGRGGSIDLMSQSEVTFARQLRDRIEIHSSQGWVGEFDYVICATGFLPSYGTGVPFEFLGVDFAGSVLGGYPIVSNEYELVAVPGAFVIGFNAQLGPRGPIDSILWGSHDGVRLLGAGIERHIRKRVVRQIRGSEVFQ